MLLVFDIGNTNITVGMYEGDKLKRTYRLTTKMRRTSDEYGFMITDFLNDANITSEDIEDVIIASVVPKVMHSFRNSIRKYLRKEPIIVGPGIKTGLNIKAEIHNQLGSDIVASAVAAIAAYPSPIVMVDLGTATSASLIAGSVYEGCVIMPGLTLALEAMWDRADALPPISLETTAPVELLGRTTEEAMRSGALYGHAAMLDGVIDRMEAAAGSPVTVVATGGSAPRILRYCKRTVHYDADLVMRGLYLLHQKNSRKPRRA